jgi:hypothetical protein
MHMIHRPLLEYVRELGIEGRQVTITGHSLGGGLARIVGSLAQLPSITFSPPGIAQSYRKFQVSVNTTLEYLRHHNLVSLVLLLIYSTFDMLRMSLSCTTICLFA